MALINGAIRFRRYAVSGNPPADLRGEYETAIRNNAFTDFREGDEREEAVGWVTVQDWFDTDLFPDLWLIDEKINLTLRKDVRKVPARYLKRECKLKEEQWKAKFDREKLTRAERDDVKSMVTKVLAERVIPTTQGVDVSWDLKRGEVLFFSTGEKANDTFRTLFERTFKVKLRPCFPFALAMDALEDKAQLANNVTESHFSGSVAAGRGG